jgi:UDP-glucose 4-epimerase
MASWLVTGGAGYIGAHVVDALHARGERAVVIDDLSTGERDRVGDATFVEGSILDDSLVRKTLREQQVRGIIHIAAKKQVGESVADPLKYYEQNVTGTLTLLSAAVAEQVPSFVFSSSAATYGMPDVEVVTEEMAGRPMSPYGETKLIGEWAARAVAEASGLRAISLRYFNVAGAARPELGDPGIFNLIPLAFEALTSGQQPKIFGADYPTRDGTCVRDYVHVSDIAAAHVAALQDLAEHGDDAPGYAVDPVVVERRPGDPARYVANVDRIRAELGWTAQHDLREMVESAWTAWTFRHPG